MKGQDTIPARSRIQRFSGVLLGLVMGAGITLTFVNTRRPPVDGTRSVEEMGAGEAMGSMEGMGGEDGVVSVRLTPAQIRDFGVTFGTAEVRELEADVRAVGVVDVAESRVREVVPRFSGFVERLYADFTGARVRAGAVLAEVYAPELVEAQEELLLAHELQGAMESVSLPGLTVSEGPDLVAAARRRLELWNIGADQIEAVVALGRPKRRLALVAPSDGVVLTKNVRDGGAFRAGEVLFTLADLGEVWMDVDVPESDAWAVRTGARVEVLVPARPGETLRGRVDYIYPVLERVTRSVRARVVISNPDERLLPGMYATVRLRTPLVTALSVPVDAVVRTGLRDIVFVDAGDGLLRPAEVRTGRTLGGFAEILDGLEVGDRVVTSAQYLIDAEANIGAVMRSMMSMMGAGDMGGMDMGGMDMRGMDMEMDGTSAADSSHATGQGR